eukprot:scaffold53059_cov21-Tisochrysis_lutea.AAC.1
MHGCMHTSTPRTEIHGAHRLFVHRHTGCTGTHCTPLCAQNLLLCTRTRCTLLCAQNHLMHGRIKDKGVMGQGGQAGQTKQMSDN